MIDFDKVVLGYDAHPVLEIPHLHITSGERVVIVGSSGSGKSTLLRAVAGFDAPLEGSISLHGACVSKAGSIVVPPYRRGLGMVFQDLALWPHMDVAENIAFGLKMQGIPKAQRTVLLDEMLKMIGLTGYASRPIDTLSGGEQQRIALARALITEPNVLLMDEPLSSLDSQRNQQLREEIIRLQKLLGFTLLYVTHNNEEAYDVATRILTFMPKKDSNGVHVIEG